MRRTVIGIDLGGTFIKAGLVEESGRLLLERKAPTPSSGQGAVLEALAGVARELLDEAVRAHNGPVQGVGLGTPGIVGPEDIRMAFNIPGWDRVPARRFLSERLQLPVFVDNDANLFALAEYVFGAGRGARGLVGFTLGTGVGGGVVVDGRLHRGYSGAAGDVGHINVEPEGEPCSCGRAGCVEAYASADAIARYARRRLIEGEDSQLRARLEAQGRLSSADVDEAARAGDALALASIARAGRYLGLAASAICAVLDPEVIVLGGGGAGFGERITTPMRDELSRRFFSAPIHMPEIRLAELGYESGLVGAACLALAELERGET